MNLSSSCLYDIGSAPVISGTTDFVSNIIDCEGCYEQQFVLNLGVVGAGCVIRVEESDVANMSSGVNQIGTSIITWTVPTVSDRLVVINCIQPLKRYLRLTMTRPVATVVNSMLSIKKPHKLPTSQRATQVSLTAVPFEGV